MINSGIQLMDLSDILAALSIQRVMFLFILPIVIIALIAYIVRRLKNRTKKKNDKKQSNYGNKQLGASKNNCNNKNNIRK